jgi:hypothetical protein
VAAQSLAVPAQWPKELAANWLTTLISKRSDWMTKFAPHLIDHTSTLLNDQKTANSSFFISFEIFITFFYNFQFHFFYMQKEKDNS